MTTIYYYDNIIPEFYSKQHNEKRKGDFKMTIIVFFAMIIICGAYEAITDYYNFNLENKIRKMQEKSKYFA